MKLMNFALNPHIQDMARLYSLLLKRHEEAQRTGMYELLPYASLDDRSKIAAQIMDGEDLICINNERNGLSDMYFLPSFDNLVYMKFRLLSYVAEKVRKHDIETNFTNCPDALLPF